jgi:hypothetical protein
MKTLDPLLVFESIDRRLAQAVARRRGVWGDAPRTWTAELRLAGQLAAVTARSADGTPVLTFTCVVPNLDDRARKAVRDLFRQKYSP